MGWNDHIDDDAASKAEVIKHLIDNEYLEDESLEIAKLFLNKGENALSEDQRHIFQRDIINEHTNLECSCCGNKIPWSEKLEFILSNDEYCAECSHKL